MSTTRLVIDNCNVLPAGRVGVPTEPEVIRDEHVSVVLFVGEPTRPDTRDVDIPALLKRWNAPG